MSENATAGKTKKVLIFPGGTEIALEIWKSLKNIKNIDLFAATDNTSNHAPFVFQNTFFIPSINEKNWISFLQEIIDKNEIDYIFPAHDDVILALNKNQEKIHAKIIANPVDTCIKLRSKKNTYKIFKNILSTPYVFKSVTDVDRYPVFIKPDKGSGSQGACKVNNAETLKNLIKNNKKCIIMENLTGKEFTVDCFSDREHGLLFCNGRERIRTRSGISMNSKPVNNELNAIFLEYAQKISKTLEFYGAWFFQLKENSSGLLKLLEIGPRISGTMATYRVIGINFALLSIYEHDRIPIRIMTNSNNIEIDRALINRYHHDLKYQKIYVDLDDTLVIGDQINTELIRFLYQSINKKCKIVLITKNEENVKEYLTKLKIFNIFDEIIVLKRSELKMDHIDPFDAIFIDDSFGERMAVYKKYKIPTFDCSMIEMLIDDRIK